MKKILIYLITITLLSGCSIGKEVVMPFRNMSYSGERLFPIEKNESEIAFRAWINNGTSIDRVITVSFDSLFKEQAKLIEFGFLTKKGILKSKDKRFYNERKIVPKSGFNHFFHSIDSLDLINYSGQDSFDYVADHQPFSLYVIEIKKGNTYNQFYFRTHFPDRTEEIEKKYELVENLIFKEFDYDFYIKK
jgi:hypothetical protein